jgi:hypothetical protein
MVRSTGIVTSVDESSFNGSRPSTFAAIPTSSDCATKFPTGNINAAAKNFDVYINKTKNDSAVSSQPLGQLVRCEAVLRITRRLDHLTGG